ncbi:hypothetical protein D910_02979 [Dendroctonus ponderosae]|uniref:Uncharacterized protein n=1 Tax=Dendroctonus ponderosae TaxID=77166 RepID=U4U6H8_DENPD|nr:hypothetical protein D910_02979 [Dendroctonus ponderosae]
MAMKKSSIWNSIADNTKYSVSISSISGVSYICNNGKRSLIERQLLRSEYADFINYLQDLAFKNYMSYHEYKEYSARIKREFLHPDQYMEVLDEVTLNIAETTGKPAINFPMKQKPNSTKGVSHIYFHAPNEVMEIMDRKDTLPHQRFLTSKYEADVVQTSQNVLPLTVEQKNCRLPLDYGEEPLLHSPVYSYNLCKFECRIKIALKYCNCTPYYYRRLAQLIYARDSSIECPNCLQNCDVYVFRGYETALPYTFLQTTLDTGIIFPNIVYIRNLVYSKIDLTGN